MKKIITLLVVVLVAFATQAQEAPTRGFLLPRMTTAERDAMINPAKGLTIFNTTTNTQELNVGTHTAPVWVSSIVNGYVAPVDPVTTIVTPAGTTPATASDLISITIPSAGVWEITWVVRGTALATNSGIASFLTDNANNPISKEIMCVYSQTALNVQSTGTGNHFVTTTGATTFKVRIFSHNVASGGQATSNANGRCYASAKRVQ